MGACGDTWTWANPLPQGNHLQAVTYGNSQFVAVGDSGTILTSPDGVAWTIQSSGTTQNLRGITGSGSQFVTVGDGGTILTSPDGVTWTLRSSGTTQNLNGVTGSGSQFVAVGDGGTILTSPDGVAWTLRSSGTTQNLRGVTGLGSQFVAVGNGGTILTSPDGVTWTLRSSGTTQNLRGVTGSGSQFVAVGRRGTILTSPDGVAWTARTSGTTQELYGVTGSGSQFVTVGSGGRILTSPDGVAWTIRSSGTTLGLYGVTWSGSQFVAVGYQGAIRTSLNGVTWTARTSGTTLGLAGVTWSGSQFIAVGGDDTILTSPDGVTWTAQTSGATLSFSHVTWSGSQFVVLSTVGILTSPDGAAWTLQSSGTTERLYSVTWSGSQFVAVGASGTILTSPDGVAWTLRSSGTTQWFNGVTWSGSQFVAVGSNGTILTSPDGVAWTLRSSGTTQWFNGVTWSGSQFVAVGSNGTILTSPDGVAWTLRSSGTTQNLLGVTWSGSQFIAVGIGDVILTSPDGVAWTPRSSGATQALRGVTWSGNQFVAVGDSGTILTSACPWGDSLALTQNRWTMIGLPAEPIPATVPGVFGDALGVNYPTDWVLYRRNYAPLQYQQLTVGDSVAQGTGYWIKNTTGNVTLSLADGAATAPLTTTHCPSTVGCYVIPLTAAASGNRYNLIGMPFPYPVGWWEAVVEVNGIAYDLGSTEANTYVAPSYWVWNGNDYDVYNVTTPGLIGMLQPWQGVWVNVLPGSIGQTVNLLIPALPKTSQRSAPADPVAVAPSHEGWSSALDWLIAPAVADDETNETHHYDLFASGRRGRDARRNANGRAIQQGQAWYVRLIAEEPTLNMRSRNNVFGQLLDSAAGYDEHDLPKLAPFGTPYLTVVFPHPDWGSKAGDYASDYRPNRETKSRGLPAASWRFEIRTDTAGRVVQLRWEGPEDVLDRSELLDEDTGARYKVKRPRYIEDGIPVTMTTPVRHFTWRYTGDPSVR